MKKDSRLRYCNKCKKPIFRVVPKKDWGIFMEVTNEDIRPWLIRDKLGGYIYKECYEKVRG